MVAGLLLTTANPQMEADQRLLQRLGMRVDASQQHHQHAEGATCR